MENQLMQVVSELETGIQPTSGQELYVGRGSYMEGTLKIRGKALINGFVQGEIYCDDFVEVGKDAKVKGIITNYPLKPGLENTRN